MNIFKKYGGKLHRSLNGRGIFSTILLILQKSPNLAQLASENLKKFSAQKGVKVDFEIVNIDASQYDIPPEADCFYFFNPFDGFIMEKVFQNIVRSLKTNPRKILIVYLNAVYKEVIEKYGFKKLKYLSKDELDYYFYCGGCVYTTE